MPSQKQFKGEEADFVLKLVSTVHTVGSAGSRNRRWLVMFLFCDQEAHNGQEIRWSYKTIRSTLTVTYALYQDRTS